MFEFNEIMGKLKEYFDVKTNAEVARKLGIDYNMIKSWSTRKKVVIGTVIELLKDEPINLTWLIYVKGNMRIGESDDILNALSKIELVLEKDVDPKIIEQISDNKKMQDLLSLFKYAPDEFIEQIIQRLKEFKKLSEI